MKDITIKLQIDSIEQQLKILKAKIFKKKSPKKLSDLASLKVKWIFLWKR